MDEHEGGGSKPLFKILLALVVVLIGWLILRKKPKVQVPPNLKAVPEVPSAYPLRILYEMLTKPPWDCLVDWTNQYGKIISFHLLSKDFVIVREPEMAKHVFQTNLKNYPKDPETFEPFKVLLGNGLVTSEGEQWHKNRRLLTPVFRAEMLRDAAAIAKEAADRLSQRFEEIRGKGVVIELAEEFRRLTLEVICGAVFSIPPEIASKAFPEHFVKIVDEANLRTFHPYRAFLPTLSNYQFHRAVTCLNDYVHNMIVTRVQDRHNPELADRKTDLFDRILDTIESETLDDKAICQLMDEVKTFLFAGHDTTSTMLTWSLYQLTQNPECLAKVIEEANEVFPDDDQMPPFEDLKKLNYTQNVLKEALRMYSVVPIVTRVAVEDDEIDGYFIPRGSKVGVLIQGIHYDPKYWDEPEKFRPERFEQQLENQYQWLPFIAGPRTCVGNHFALIEGKVVLALLVKRFKFQTVPTNTGKRHPRRIPIAPIDEMKLTVN